MRAAVGRSSELGRKGLTGPAWLGDVPEVPHQKLRRVIVRCKLGRSRRRRLLFRRDFNVKSDLLRRPRVKARGSGDRHGRSGLCHMSRRTPPNCVVEYSIRRTIIRRDGHYLNSDFWWWRIGQRLGFSFRSRRHPIYSHSFVHKGLVCQCLAESRAVCRCCSFRSCVRRRLLCFGQYASLEPSTGSLVLTRCCRIERRSCLGRNRRR